MKNLTKLILILNIILIAACQNENKFEVYDGQINVLLPEEWNLKGIVIYDQNENKVGEIPPPSELIIGQEYIENFKKGFSDDPESTKYIANDSLLIDKEMWYLVSRKGTYESSNGQTGYWFSYNFMRRCNSQSIYFTFYDYNGKLPKWTEEILSNVKCNSK